MTQYALSRTSRREFLKDSASALGAAAVPLSLSSTSLAVPLSEKLRVGIVGCGGRGTGALSQALNADPNVELTAMADLFDDHLQQCLGTIRKMHPNKVAVTPDRCFLGFDAYQKLIDSGVDVVLLTTPPGFRPRHLRAAVEAGKHIFAEKVPAVDAPGVRSLLESSEMAKNKKLAIVSGYCWRYNYRVRAAVEQMRNGAIGEIRSLYSTYMRRSVSPKFAGARTPGMSEMEYQIRNWYDYTWLSGELSILGSGGHSVDKMSWFMKDEMPIKAVALGGRQFPGEGNIFDHAMVAYEYANGVRGFLACRVMDGCHSENADYVTGCDGVLTMGRKPIPEITGRVKWVYSGTMNDMFQTEHDELFASIRAGKPINDGFRMARTTLMAIMGRMAAYTGQEITWEQAFNSQENLVPEHIGWDTKFDLPPVAMPGKTKFT